jgi:hypothetical protein
MNPRLRAVVLAACLLVSSLPSAAQTNQGDITFTVPINVTQLLADITKVRVTCAVTSQAITDNRRVEKGVTQPGQVGKAEEYPVSNGQVVRTVTIVLSVAGVLENPTGKVASYGCNLQGYSNSLQRWAPFNHCQSSATGNECTEVAFRLSPLQQPGNTGTFTW